MDEITFLTMEDVLEAHRESLERFGGQDGFIDRGVVESALAKPQWLLAYAEDAADLDAADLAAEYMHAIATRQGFMDGNKRTAVLCAYLFLAFNGFDLDLEDRELYPVAIGVATGQISKKELADFLRQHLVENPAE
jgi:death on curing protein